MTDRRVAASARRGILGRWAGRRLSRAAACGDSTALDALATIARTPGHRLRERAKERVAARWAETLDPDLREVVVETGAVAAEAPAHLRVLALEGRMDEWRGSEAGWAAALLADENPDVRERTAGACRGATWPLHESLWRADTGPGTPLRAALLANGTPPPTPELNALWRTWLADPSDELGAALLRWRRRATDPDLVSPSVVASSPGLDELPHHLPALIGALDRPGHPIRGIAAGKIAALQEQGAMDDVCSLALAHPDRDLVRLCAKHGFVPGDSARRAAFFLLTGQAEQLRALDPDGSLLALAYASGSRVERARIREALPDAGDLDLVRVIVGRDDRRARITDIPEAEIRYLTERLAERREWDELWALVLDLPVVTGAEVVRLLGTWEPRDESARRVLALFREADPSAIAYGVQRIRESTPAAVHRTRLRFQGRVNDVSFSPDAASLAIAGTNRITGVYEVRSGRRVRAYDGIAPAVDRVLHIGDGTIIACEHRDHIGRAPLVRCTDDLTVTLHSGPGTVTSLTATGDAGRFAIGTSEGRLLLGTPDLVTEVDPITFGDPTWRENIPRTVTGHRPSGRVATVAFDIRVFEPDTEWSAGADRDGLPTRLAFIDADTLVYSNPRGEIGRLRLEDSWYAVTHRALVSEVAGLAVLPPDGDPVVLADNGFLYLLDPATLHLEGAAMLDGADAGPDGEPRPASPTSLAVAPGGDLLAVGDAAGHVDMYDVGSRELPRLVGRPLAELVPRHLGLVAAARAAPGTSREALLTLRIIEACLHHRFRFDVEVGEAVRPAGGEHDISL